MRRAALAIPALVLASALAAGPAAAQSEQENRLREALRRATADLRGAQDAQARLQAEATEAKAQRDRLQQQLDAQAARLAELEGRPTGPPPELLAELDQLRAAGRALQEQNEALNRTLARWQASQAEAVGFARAKEGERAAWEASFGRARAAIEACEAKNGQLLAAATEILGLYRQPEFRSLIQRSQEPLLGFWRVRLENIVQDHEDRIREGRYHRDPNATTAPPPGSPLPANPQGRGARGATRPQAAAAAP